MDSRRSPLSPSGDTAERQQAVVMLTAQRLQVHPKAGANILKLPQLPVQSEQTKNAALT